MNTKMMLKTVIFIGTTAIAQGKAIKLGGGLWAMVHFIF
jgi:hypothetical protein